MNKATIITASVLGGVIVLGGTAYGAAAYATSHSHPAVAAAPSAKPTHKHHHHKHHKAAQKIIVVPAAPAPAAAAQPDYSGDASGSYAVEVVNEYYGYLNARDFTDAWSIGGANIGGSSYFGWVHGYDTTADIAVSTWWDGSAVETTITATQTDGTVKTFAGTYTVAGGVITSANIAQTG